MILVDDTIQIENLKGKVTYVDNELNKSPALLVGAIAVPAVTLAVGLAGVTACALQRNNERRLAITL